MFISSQSGMTQFQDDACTVGRERLRFLPNVPDHIRLILLAVLVGLLAGIAALILKWAVAKISMLIYPHGFSYRNNWVLILMPVAGILFTGIYQRYVLHDYISHGVDKLVDDLLKKKYLLSPKLTYASIIASSMTLGFGGSAGSEGPIAYTGAAIGSNVGRLCGVSAQTIYFLIACGASAGIAGIFKAPIGGALFAIEVLGMSLTTVSVIALFVASITSALTVYSLSGFTFDIDWHNIIAFNPSIIGWTLVLGGFCGLYSVYYSYIMRTMRNAYESVGNPLIRNLLSGVTLSMMLVLFPSLWGEGYNVIGNVINGDWQDMFGDSILNFDRSEMIGLPMVLAGILLMKSFACSATNSGGGVAGDFAPTLYAGCIAGLFFALVVNKICDAELSPQIFAYIGMAGVMSGVIRAPLMSLFLTAEMCNGFDYFLPLTIVSMVSYGTVRLVTRKAFHRTHIYYPHRHH